jgi:hypothetical protein
MTKRNPAPFQFDVSSLADRARTFVGKHIGGATISLPFLSFSVVPDDIEKKVAREILIRLKDKRVLCSQQCCHSCTELALKSLSEARATLVDKQVELSELTDGALFLLIDYMLVGIREFLTYEETLRVKSKVSHYRSSTLDSSFLQFRDEYLSSLEQLRAHLNRCLQQVATIADLPKDKTVLPMDYSPAWERNAYKEIKGSGA